MQIGRRIYYELTTGNIIQDTGERQGSVVETTVEQDFEAYVSLSEREPATVGAVDLNYGDNSASFQSCSGYTINPSTQEIVFDFTPIPQPSAEELKQQRILALQAELASLQS